MKNKIQPNNIEIPMRDDDFIITKTDPAGVLTYVNQTFVEFSGYREKELIGKQHNIIRHPDMPRAVFKMLWDTLKSGHEFNGYVKNLNRDGRHYWVLANVTPSLDDKGVLLGYYSVRRKPSKAALEIIEDIYHEMLEAEKKAGAKRAIEVSRQILEHLLKQNRMNYDEYILAL